MDNPLDQLYKTVFNYFYSQSDKQDVTCEVDGDSVDCLTFNLEDKGFTYNKQKDWGASRPNFSVYIITVVLMKHYLRILQL